MHVCCLVTFQLISRRRKYHFGVTATESDMKYSVKSVSTTSQHACSYVRWTGGDWQLSVVVDVGVDCGSVRPTDQVDNDRQGHENQLQVTNM